MSILERFKKQKRNRDCDWDIFDAQQYREHNYLTIESVDDEVLRDMVDFYANERPSGRFLEVGAGSNMYPILAALPYAGTLDIWEYGAKNVVYLRQQCQELDPEWQQWIDRLRELNSEVYEQVDFQQQLKDKVTITQGSIFHLPEGVYDNISMHSVAESLTERPREFDRAVRCFIAAGKERATFVTTFVENSSGYDSPGQNYPAVPIYPSDAAKIFIDNMRSIKVDSTKTDIRPGSPLIKIFGRLK